jgi:ATP-dependent Clp protease ATP-binding subunit ClpX
MAGNCDWCQRPSNEVKGFVTPPGRDFPRICFKCSLEAAVISSAATGKKGQTKAIEGESRKGEEPVPTPREIKAILDQHVIGQERAKINVSTAVYNHYKRRSLFKNPIISTGKIQKSNILLTGPSGTGKTEIARTIAELLRVPFHIADATRLTQAGYVGDDVETIFGGLLQNAEGDVEKAQWGIVFLDEVDKIARQGRMGGGRDVSGEGVQQALLKPLEGSKVSVSRGNGRITMVGANIQASDVIDTNNILFICAGSFAGIESIVEQRCNKGARLGFGSSVEKKKMTKSDIYSQICEEDLLDFGMIPEFIGRIPVHTTTLSLTEEEMIRVLTEPKNSIIKQFKQSFEIDGIRLTFSDDALAAIAQEAMGRPTGARALRSIVEKTLERMSFDAPGSDIDSIHVTGESIKTGEFLTSLRGALASG